MAERFYDIEKPLVSNQPSSPETSYLSGVRLCALFPCNGAAEPSPGIWDKKSSLPLSLGGWFGRNSLAVRCLGHCYQLHAKTMGLPLQGEKLALLPLALKFGGAPVHPGLALGDQSIVEAG